MKYFILLGLLWCTLLQATSQYEEDPYKNIRYYKLDNGLQVYQLHDKKAENTQVKLTVNLGYDIEDESDYGIAHLIEHMVFRDQRVPYHDYLDYMKEEGATYVNGYTKRYETGYLATIDSEKSYWIIETFSKMIFDKNVSDEDIRVEKGALQTEIGESHWYYKPLWGLKTFFETIVPKKEKFYLHEFGMQEPKERPAHYHAQDNNKKFTLTQLLSRYNNYYYPANMTLVVVGNFDPNKMKSVITQTFGKVRKKGTKSAKEPQHTPILTHKPYRRFYEGSNFNGAYIGSKYIEDDYTKYLILSAYNENLADRLQQKMRNIDGKTYSVNASYFSQGKAAISTIYFDALHDDFEENLKTVHKVLQQDIKHINNETINKALKSYEKTYYASIEHDNESLMELVDTAQYLREECNLSHQTSYEVFKTITPEIFRQTLKNIYKPENSYSITYRDYYFFPMEMSLLSLLALGLLVFLYMRLYRFQLKSKNLIYTQRDLVLQRRVSSRFIGFLIFIFTSLFASILSEWIRYLFSKAVWGDPYYVMGIDVPYSYIATVLDPMVYLILFFTLYHYIWRYYARIDVIDKGVVAIGNRISFIATEEIASIETTPWKPQYYRKTIGTALRFWRPLVHIRLKNSEHIYLRTIDAEHLKEDLEKVFFV